MIAADMHVDVVVVGAGFAGLACARVLAERGHSVVVLERKSAPGIGMHTTGILVREAADITALPDTLVRRITGVRLYSPSMRSLRIDSDSYFFLATDTPAMMAHFTQSAVDAGVEVRFDTPYVHADYRDERYAIAGTGLSCRWLVGADGPRSKVAADLSLGQNREYLLGVEAEFENVAMADDQAFHCFLGKTFAPGYLGWVIPGVGITQIGLATRMPAKPDIDRFVAHVAPLFDMSQAGVTARRGGLIPVGGVVSPFTRDRAILLGDAAGTVSPLSAGGIHTALHYGELLANLIVDHDCNAGPDPAAVLAEVYPRFRLKHILRWTLENAAPDLALDLMIGNPLFRALANTVFFKTKRLPGE